MAELSSCYFCGSALDASLERRTVADTAGETTVVVCPSCRRKLVAVLDRVLDADPAAERDSLLAMAIEGDGRTTPETPPEADAERDDGPSADARSEASGDRSATTNDAGTETRRDDSGGVAASPTTVSGESDPIFADDGDDAAGDDTAVFGSEDATVSVGDDGPNAVREAEPDRSDAPEDTADDGPADRPDAATYNRVVRLLQNREFPVPTAEIEDVAVNAYDLDSAEFRAVIDTAVDRGVLTEEGDQLHRPD